MFRRLTSLTALLSFALVLVTSVVLYIVPAGRVAYWADWRLWGLTKEQWGALHINLGTLFLLALLLHAWFNWKAITNYLQARARESFRLSPELLWSALLVTVFSIGTLAALPPFSNFLQLNAWFKDEAVRMYGEPPYGHAELSPLASFAAKVGMDLPRAMENLRAAGMAPKNDQESVGSIAERNKVSPQRLYQVMQGGVAAKDAGGASAELPLMAPSGTGQLTLADFSARHGLDLATSIRALAAGGIPAKGDMTLKKIAQAAGRAPTDVYDILRASAAKGR
ncbi:MAG: DUF4405 domain-containing protein [Proteobacteria bacterium]|nr:DUF4405 domain-containing protein [Pseudomonadota bacterium]MBU1595007.1 DUF4405 domain-containing protein [Pseudomonadota bacterium]